jgi:acetyl esterase/lipase
MKVLVVDYSLAPEAPFPKGLNDVVHVYNYLCNNGYSPNNIGIIGDSAGGELALAMLLRLKETNSELPAAIGLLSPWGDLNLNGDTMTTLAGVDPILSKEQLSAFAKLYVQKEDANHHLVSPVYGDYKGFPPMMIITGSREILLSDTIRIAQNAIKNQVEISFEIYEGLWHVFCADPSLPESNDALEKLASFFTKYLM